MRRFLVKRAVLLASLLLVALQTVRVEAARGDVVPLSGTVGYLRTSLTSYSSVSVDDQNQRVYIASRSTNTIVAMDFLGTQTAIRSTFAQPSALAVGGGYAYALLAGTGQVVRLNPTTLAPTVLVGGLIEPHGLVYSGGFLYVFSCSAPSPFVLKRVDAVTGTTTDTLITTFDSDFRLWAFPQHPGVLFGTKGNVSPGGMHRWELETGVLTYVSESAGEMAALPDGQLLALSGGWEQTRGVSAKDPFTFAWTGRVWQMADAPAWEVSPFTWATSQHTVAVGASGLLELDSTSKPGEVYRRYRFPDFPSADGFRVELSADSSRVFVIGIPYGVFNPTVEVYALPGVGIESPPIAPNPASGSARTAAPRASGANITRTGAPQTNGSPPWVMNGVTDIEFATDGSVYVSDETNDVVDRFAPDGTPIGGWRNLAGVESLAELNGSMFAVVPREGSVVRFDPTQPELTRIVQGIPGLGGLTAGNGKLWSTYYFQYASKVLSVDPATRTVWRQPDDYGSGYRWDFTFLAEKLVNGNLLGWGAYEYSGLLFNLGSLSFGSQQNDLEPPYALSPDGLTLIDGSGRRATTASFALDGFVFPGFAHTISGSTASGLALIAARTQYSGGSLTVYNEANPGEIVYSESPPEGYTFGRIEFRPGSTELWVTLTSNESGQAFVFPVDVGPVPYTAEIGDETDVDLAAVFPLKRVAAAFSQQMSSGFTSAAAYSPPGTAVSTPPSTVVNPAGGGTVPRTGPNLTADPNLMVNPDPGALLAPVLSTPPVTQVQQPSTSLTSPTTTPRSIPSLTPTPPAAVSTSVASAAPAKTSKVSTKARSAAWKSPPTTKPRRQTTKRR